MNGDVLQREDLEVLPHAFEQTVQLVTVDLSYLLGLNDEKVTYRSQGWDFRLRTARGAWSRSW